MVATCDSEAMPGCRTPHRHRDAEASTVPLRLRIEIAGKSICLGNLRAILAKLPSGRVQAMSILGHHVQELSSLWKAVETVHSHCFIESHHQGQTEISIAGGLRYLNRILAIIPLSSWFSKWQ